MTQDEAAKECCRPMDSPHGWIQWKGTEVCMDIYCVCGYHGHIDVTFAYHYRCVKCQRVFALDPNIRMIELTAPLKPGSAFVEDEDEQHQPFVAE